MSWIKKVFTDFQTVIDAAFLNGIQDQIIADETDLANKVDKVTGKGLSTQDFTTALKNKLQALPMAETLDTELDAKVDKVEGKGLSTNDYTNAEKQRVADSALQTDLDALDDRVDQIYNGGVLYDTAGPASIASFDDGADNMPVKKLVAQIDPVQDLHGYDNPWPGGGGKNLANPVTTGVVINGVTFTVNKDSDGNIVSFTANGTATNRATFAIVDMYLPVGSYTLNGCPGGADDTYWLVDSAGTFSGKVYGNNNLTATLSEEKRVLLLFQVEAGVTVTNATVYPMIRLAAEADATFAPYSNECPISGWTGAEITSVNGNLLPVNYTGGTSNGVTATVASDKKVELSGTSTGNSIFVLNNAVKLPKGNFTLKGHPGGNNSVILSVLEYLNGSYTGAVYNDVGSGVTFASKGDAYDYTVRIVTYTAGGNLNKFTISPQIVPEGSVAAYAPYTGNQISVTFPSSAGTVYGGTLTLNPDRTGTLVVDFGASKVKDLTWVTSSLNNVIRMVAVVNNIKHGSNNNYIANAISDQYKVTYVNILYSAADNNKFGVSDDGRIFVLDTRYTTTADFVANEGESVFCYKLASPQTIQLTAEQVSGILTTLYGTNNIWADTGDVTVTAPRDIKLYIEKLTQPTEDDMTADHAISSGTFFMIGNTLYLATSQIAAGGTITPGTNATKLSLADALNTLNS